MIIQRRGDELLFITQIAHAALAADLMDAWQLGGLPDNPRRDAILSATRNHDDGWREEDAELYVDKEGSPQDFVAVPPEIKQRIWPRAAGRLGAESPYIGALVAEHALTVYARLRDDPAWHRFFADMERTRDALLARASPDEAAGAADDYRFVRIGDQLSLIFCNGWTAPLEGPGYRAILNGNTLEISPDPFDGRRVPMQIEARSVPPHQYPSAAELRTACAASPVRMLEGEAIGTRHS